MPVRKDEHGQRSVKAEVEVTGSPEEVWRAIATGKGISSWFVPTTVDGRDGGSAVSSFGPGMDSVAKITTWNPPQNYVAETEEEGLGKVATEWIVEARGGGKCVVRVVHRWFASTDDWDGQFEGHAYGWATSFFRMLSLYLRHFPGQACAAFQLTAMSQEPGPATWRKIKHALQVGDQSANQADAHSERNPARATSAPGVPELAGVIENLDTDDPELLRIRETSAHIAAALEGMEGESPELLVRLERPAPGFAHIFTMPIGGPTMVSARFHFFGETAAKTASEAEQAWQAWLASQFPDAPAG